MDKVERWKIAQIYEKEYWSHGLAPHTPNWNKRRALYYRGWMKSFIDLNQLDNVLEIGGGVPELYATLKLNEDMF